MKTLLHALAAGGLACLLAACLHSDRPQTGVNEGARSKPQVVKVAGKRETRVSKVSARAQSLRREIDIVCPVGEPVRPVVDPDTLSSLSLSLPQGAAASLREELAASNLSSMSFPR